VKKQFDVKKRVARITEIGKEGLIQKRTERGNRKEYGGSHVQPRRYVRYTREKS